MFRFKRPLREIIIHPKFWEDRYGQVAWGNKPVEEKEELKQECYDEIDNWLNGNSKSPNFFTGSFTNPSSGEVIPYIKIEKI